MVFLSQTTPIEGIIRVVCRLWYKNNVIDIAPSMLQTCISMHWETLANEHEVKQSCQTNSRYLARWFTNGGLAEALSHTVNQLHTSGHHFNHISHPKEPGRGWSSCCYTHISIFDQNIRDVISSVNSLMKRSHLSMQCCRPKSSVMDLISKFQMKQREWHLYGCVPDEWLLGWSYLWRIPYSAKQISTQNKLPFVKSWYCLRRTLSSSFIGETYVCEAILWTSVA